MIPGNCLRDNNFMSPAITYKDMLLRDYFAAQAIQGMLACPTQPQSGPDMYARDAYTLADAMMKERNGN